MISLLLLAGAVAAQPYYYMPYAGMQGRADPNVDEATARYLINFGVFQMATATVATVTGAIPAGVSGTVRFFQNPFIANDNSRFTVEIVGLAPNTAYWVCLLPTNVVETPIIAANFLPDGTALQIPVALTSGTSPGFQLFNRFTVKGSNTVFNVDLASTKRGVRTVNVGIFAHACAGTAMGTGGTFVEASVLARSTAMFV